MDSRGKAEEKLEELIECLNCTAVQRLENEIRLIRNNSIIATLLLDEEHKDLYYGIHYYNQAKLVRTEIYTDGISYTNYYVTAGSDKGVYAKK